MFCPKCGAKNLEEAEFVRACGAGVIEGTTRNPGARRGRTA